MAAQSFAMGEAFGKSFQFGKRKISAMSNEEFNKLSAEDLHQSVQADITKMIPHMKASFETMEKFQSEVVNSIIRGIVETIGNIGGAFTPTSTTATAPPITNVNYAGSIGLPLGALKASDPYTQWLQTKDLLEKQLKDFISIAPTRKPVPPAAPVHRHTLEHHFTPTRAAPKVDTTKLAGFGTSQSADALKKAALLNNLKFAEEKWKQQSENSTRLHLLYAKSKGGMTKNKQDEFVRELNRIRNVVADLAKKVANIKTQLRNVR